MEPAERLAAFLAGELSADERQALEADLARDAGLRADLDAMRRADEVLATEAPTALPDGARQRLHEALAPTLDAELGAAQPAAAPTDELSRRRAAASRRSWLTAVGGVAAAVAAIAIVAPNLGGSDDQADVVSDVAAPASDDGALEEAGEESATTSAAPVGPTLLGSDRSIDADGAAELLAAGEVEAVVAQGLSVDEAAELGGSWSLAFGVGDDLVSSFSADLEAEPAPADEGEAAELEDDAERAQSAERLDGAADAAGVGPADLQVLGDVDERDQEDVRRCLSTLVPGGGVMVPALAELVTFEGEPAIAFALVSLGPDDAVTRREVWVLEREGCEVRYFRQS